MAYLLRLESRPNPNSLTEDDRKFVEDHVQVNANEVTFNGRAMELSRVQEIEVAKAARATGPAGWIVKKVLYGGDRYHVALYAGRGELVLPNVTLEVAQFVVQTIAFFARYNTLKYTGPEGISPISES
jgi:hypothetical protein